MMKLSLLNFRVAVFGALFFLASSFLNSVQSHHIRGIPGVTGLLTNSPCVCIGADGKCASRNANNNTCPVSPLTGKLTCSNDHLRCPGNRERCCLFDGICGCPDPCDASICRPVASTSIEVHGVSVVTMSVIEIPEGETGLKCDLFSDWLKCCKDSICSPLPEVVIKPETINTFDGVICSSDRKRVLQYYANVTEVILLWAHGREHYGKESDGGFRDLVGEVIEKLLGRTPNNLNLPFPF